jgi:hypothetical protein
MKWKRFSIPCALGLAMIFAMASIAAATTHPPDINPANFVHPITNPNPFFPLVPGTTFTYTGEKDGVSNTNVTEVTCDILVIEGVTTTVVHDQALDASGNVKEDTFDYYAQDKDGNVWYFGEDTIELATGSTEGTWRAGVDDADPGLIMEANSKVGDRYYQEFAPKVAVDQAKVISLNGSAGSFDNLLVTKETSQLDPGVVENKYYASGIGFILAETVKGGDERTELVSITNSPCP